MIESLSDIVEKRIAKLSLKRPLEATRVCEAYFVAIKEINRLIAEKTEPLFYKNRILTVSVPSSSFANELLMCQHMVVKKINENLKEELVTRIRYQIRR